MVRLRTEMEALMRRIGFTGTLEAFFAFLRTDPQFYLPNTEAGRQQYLATARVHLAERKPGCLSISDGCPRPIWW